MNHAIIDLGTNTFHLAIYIDQKLVSKVSKAAKLGLGGIEKNVITQEAMERGLEVLISFKAEIDKFKIQNVLAIGTSALRNANNANEFCDMIKNQADIEIEIIDGQKEAEYIYHGVKAAVKITTPSLIVDIGGGSIECIICNQDRKLWSQSFEIGGLRLMEKFMPNDMLDPMIIPLMSDFFRVKLLDLHNAIHQYRPYTLIGSSGSFDTLIDMYHAGLNSEFNGPGFEYPLNAFYEAYEKLVFANRADRLAIPGMIPLRVDMIVVAMVFIAYLIKSFDIKTIKVSNYSLLEGVNFTNSKNAN